MESTISRVNEILSEGNSNVLFFMKGQIRNIQKKMSSKTNMPYYIADVRTPKLVTDDIYQAAFNVANVCFSSEFVKTHGINDDFMKSIKDNEILLQISYTCYVDKYKKDNEEYKVNRMTLYVENIMQTRNVNKPQYNPQTINI